MRGVITMRHVLSHAPTVVRSFGWATLFLCLLSAVRRDGRTFLQIVWR